MLNKQKVNRRLSVSQPVLVWNGCEVRHTTRSQPASRGRRTEPMTAQELQRIHLQLGILVGRSLLVNGWMAAVAAG